MRRAVVERRLSQVHGRLRKARQELAVVDEHLAALAEDADEARIRSLVSETPLAERELEAAERHVEAMVRSRQAVLTSIGDLERAEDQLLGRLTTP